MFKRMFRRRRPAPATRARIALHGTVQSLSGAAFGYGTTYIGADPPTAAGLGMSLLTVLMTFFPLPRRKDTDAPQQADPGQEPAVTEEPSACEDASAVSEDQAAEEAVSPEELSATPEGELPSPPAGAGRDAQPDPVVAGAPATDAAAVTPSGPGAASAVGVTGQQVGPVLVWEPRLEIRPHVTVGQPVFDQTSGPAEAAGPVGEEPVEPDRMN